jgi:hypothetical protein
LGGLAENNGVAKDGNTTAEIEKFRAMRSGAMVVIVILDCEC